MALRAAADAERYAYGDASLTSINITGPVSVIPDDIIEVDHEAILPGMVVQFVRKSENRVVVQPARARRELWFAVEAGAKRGELCFRVQDLFWLDAPSHHVDDSKPLLYLWEIFDGNDPVFKYVGKSETGANRPRTHYRQNVRRLLAGLSYRPSKPDGFRAVHRQLALAARRGWDVRLRLIRNVLRRENIFDAERQAQLEYSVTAFPGVSEA